MSLSQEPDRLPGTRILWALGGVLLFTAVGVAAAWALLVAGGRPLGDPRLGAVPEEMSHVEQVLIEQRAPGLEEREAARQRLEQYAWRDRESGRVSIPIERAIEIYVARAGAEGAETSADTEALIQAPGEAAPGEEAP
ncbi:hypothetical protein [Haliangium ochraceum]|uniref:Uncharacterized protein n=1 Tax=Haliangium ochraceum (strain DSM 14365 / JCM 11303 / SMP-2) TaxID=502025 RepID=D0LN60_HALO1|nr:hypothetical protein [Haliangium ochraceum]ACY15237.1 hypothetical protein Hoch_2708 [Haliangium ochraceum DSM 14365]